MKAQIKAQIKPRDTSNMKYRLSLLSALLSVSLSATATLEIDLSGLDEGVLTTTSPITGAKTNKRARPLVSGSGQVPSLVQGTIPETVSANGRYHQSSSVSSSVYSSRGAITGLRRNVELVAPKGLSLSLSAPQIWVNDDPEPAKTPAIILPAIASTASSLLSSPKTPAIEVVAAADDESMLSFIDEWLGIDPVKPWEKGTLAEKAMKPGGVVPEFDRFSEKVFSYKQGSVGGSGVGGGGCGCN